MVEHPTECFRKHVRRIHDSRKVNQNDVLHESPMLKCKIYDFHMTRATSGLAVIDDLDRGIVVFINGSRLSLSVPQLVKNESQIFGDFRRRVGCYEFSFCGTLCTNGLRARTICHDTTRQTASASCSGSMLTQFVSVSGIDVSGQLWKMGRRRNDG